MASLNSETVSHCAREHCIISKSSTFYPQNCDAIFRNYGVVSERLLTYQALTLPLSLCSSKIESVSNTTQKSRPHCTSNEILTIAYLFISTRFPSFSHVTAGSGCPVNVHFSCMFSFVLKIAVNVNVSQSLVFKLPLSRFGQALLR